MMEERVKTEINEWIVRAALAGTDEIEIVAGVCQQLSSAGVALVRSSIVTNLLDPTIDARAVRWNRGQGALEEAFPRSDDPASEEWMRSPFFFLMRAGAPSFRRRLDATYCAGEFPMLDDFRAQGVTDYLAFAERVGDSVLLGEGEGMVSSWTTDAPAGFSDAQVDNARGDHACAHFGVRAANNEPRRARIDHDVSGERRRRARARG